MGGKMDKYLEEKLKKCYAKIDAKRKKISAQINDISINDQTDLSEDPTYGGDSNESYLKLESYLREIDNIVSNNDSNRASDFLYEHCKELMT